MKKRINKNPDLPIRGAKQRRIYKHSLLLNNHSL